MTSDISTENQAIVATDLTKWFGEGESRTTAVNGVGLVAHFGEMLFIVGPSGSGKTTMLSRTQDVVTAQIAVLTNQRVAMNLQMQQTTASVQLIKALGGGWDISQTNTAALP